MCYRHIERTLSQNIQIQKSLIGFGKKKTKAKLVSPYLMYGEHVDRELYLEVVWGGSPGQQR